jgi:hypothetical protein
MGTNDTIDPLSKIRPQDTGDANALSVAQNTAGSVQPHAFAAARARGLGFSSESYANPDNLALLEAKTYAGRNERAINVERQLGHLYALLPPGKTQRFRYPKWQFDVDPKRLAAVLGPFANASTNCWVIHSFMLRKRDELDGQSPAEVIADAHADLAPVVALGARDLSGEHGAS